MPNPRLLEHEDALTRSVIRKTIRPYDKAFHSACVAAGLMYFYHCLGDEPGAESFVSPMQQTIRELCENDQKLSERGLQVLTTNGREIISSLKRFVDNRDYALIASALESQIPEGTLNAI